MKKIKDQVKSPKTKDKPEIFKPWERMRVQTDVEDQEVRVDTSFGNDTDVNNIVERFKRTGTLPEPETAGRGQFADVTNLQEDLTPLLQRVEEAQKEVELAEKAVQQKAAEKAAQDAERLKQYDQEREQQENTEPPPGTE